MIHSRLLQPLSPPPEGASVWCATRYLLARALHLASPHRQRSAWLSGHAHFALFPACYMHDATHVSPAAALVPVLRCIPYPLTRIRVLFFFFFSPEVILIELGQSLPLAAIQGLVRTGGIGGACQDGAPSAQGQDARDARRGSDARMQHPSASRNMGQHVDTRKGKENTTGSGVVRSFTVLKCGCGPRKIVSHKVTELMLFFSDRLHSSIKAGNHREG